MADDQQIEMSILGILVLFVYLVFQSGMTYVSYLAIRELANDWDSDERTGSLIFAFLSFAIWCIPNLLVVAAASIVIRDINQRNGGEDILIPNVETHLLGQNLRRPQHQDVEETDEHNEDPGAAC